MSEPEENLPDFSLPEQAAAEQSAAAPAEGGTPASAEVLLEERTRDLQRLQAEYANYRKRVERDRVAVREQSEGIVLASLLPVLDDIQRAHQHGDVAGPFKAVADKLATILDKLGLQPFGDVGDPFDPNIHEAVSHDESPDVSVPTCTAILRPGFRHGERLLRPAMVGVSEPSGPVSPSAAPPADPASAAEPEPATSTGGRHAMPDEPEEPPVGWHVPKD